MHGEDEVAGGVEEIVAVTDAQDGALAPQHDDDVSALVRVTLPSERLNG